MPSKWRALTDEYDELSSAEAVFVSCSIATAIQQPDWNWRRGNWSFGVIKTIGATICEILNGPHRK